VRSTEKPQSRDLLAILGLITEDYYGLWEIADYLQGTNPSLPASAATRRAQDALRWLIQHRFARIYSRKGSVGRPRWIRPGALDLGRTAVWASPTPDSFELVAAATKSGWAFYATRWTETVREERGDD
jgi:hypothetical protein